MSRTSRLQQWIGYRIRVTAKDAKVYVGVLLAFDRHMNLVMADTEEFRLVKAKYTNPGTTSREYKRALGLSMIRGENVVSFVPEVPVDPGNTR